MKFKITIKYEYTQEFEGDIQDLEREVNRVASIEGQKLLSIKVKEI